MSQFVKLVNRTSKMLKGTWDGRQYDLAPGDHFFPAIQAYKFKEQNPVMGSEDPVTGDKRYLIGLPENGDDCSPVEQTNAPSLQDLRDKISSGEYRVVAGNGLYNRHTDASLPLPLDSNFVKA